MVFIKIHDFCHSSLSFQEDNIKCETKDHLPRKVIPILIKSFHENIKDIYSVVLHCYMEHDLPKDNMEGCLTQHLTSRIPLGWVDGILQPLPMVVHRSAHQDQGSRMKDMHHDDDDKVH